MTVFSRTSSTDLDNQNNKIASYSISTALDSLVSSIQFNNLYFPPKEEIHDMHLKDAEVVVFIDYHLILSLFVLGLRCEQALV
jgi:hypothetical protein